MHGEDSPCLDSPRATFCELQTSIASPWSREEGGEEDGAVPFEVSSGEMSIEGLLGEMKETSFATWTFFQDSQDA